MAMARRWLVVLLVSAVAAAVAATSQRDLRGQLLAQRRTLRQAALLDLALKVGGPNKEPIGRWPTRGKDDVDPPLLPDERLGLVNAPHVPLYSHPFDGCLTANNNTCSGHGVCVSNPGAVFGTHPARLPEYPWCKCQAGWFNAGCAIPFANISHATKVMLNAEGYVKYDIATKQWSQTQKGARGLLHSFMAKAEYHMKIPISPYAEKNSKIGTIRSATAPRPRTGLDRWTQPHQDVMLAGQRMEGQFEEKNAVVGIKTEKQLDKVPLATPPPTLKPTNPPGSMSKYTNWKGRDIIAPSISPYQDVYPPKVINPDDEPRLLRTLTIMAKRVDRYGAPQSVPKASTKPKPAETTPPVPGETPAPSVKPTSKPNTHKIPEDKRSVREMLKEGKHIK